MKPRAGSSVPAAFSPTTPRAREVDVAIERIAQRTAKLVLDEMAEWERSEQPASWTTTAQVAAHLQIDPEWVTSHGYELGGVRLGDGPKARWRFPTLERVDELLRERSLCSEGRPSEATEQRSAAPAAPRRRRRVSGTRAPLLPIKGEERGS